MDWQASIIAVYAYGFISLMARGFVDSPKDINSEKGTEIIINYFPLIPSLQVIYRSILFSILMLLIEIHDYK